MNPLLRNWFVTGICLSTCLLLRAQVDDPRQRHYNRTVQPILRKHCYGCHNGEDKKGGIAINDHYFISAIVRNGELYQNVVEAIEAKSMPPDIRPPMEADEIDTVTHYLRSYLQSALAEKDPGIIAPRRLNNQEYRYAIEDLLGLQIDTDSIFPADPSGGAGFDNHAGVLYMTPLLVERYFEVADHLLDTLYADRTRWRTIVPEYRNSWQSRWRVYWQDKLYGRDVSLERPLNEASKILFPFANLAYRRFLETEEEDRLLGFFREAYELFDDKEDRFDASIRETMKRVLVSHQFLYRVEFDPEIEGPYPINDFELASRISFFLWSSIPDQHLLNAAYREDLHDPAVLEREVNRMLSDRRSRRLGEQFATQWLEVKKLKDPTFQVDPGLYPEYTPELSGFMIREVSLFFNNIVAETKNFLELLDSDYTFLNEDLACHYDIPGIEGPDMRKVRFASNRRGGVLGMAGVLTATSLPTRTSPVLRGKWVLEQILGTPAPPPPPNVPELEASHDPNRPVESLRVLLERHRADPACRSCHESMDPIGLGLENFDGIGRWRNAYESESIDASGVMKSGETFNGPAQLRKILLDKRELFSKNLTRKMLAYALGRSLGFKDTPTVEHLQKVLLQSNFNSDQFILEVIKSYPFRYKKSDNQDVKSNTKVG